MFYSFYTEKVECCQFLIENGSDLFETNNNVNFIFINFIFLFIYFIYFFYFIFIIFFFLFFLFYFYNFFFIFKKYFAFQLDRKDTPKNKILLPKTNKCYTHFIKFFTTPNLKSFLYYPKEIKKPFKVFVSSLKFSIEKNYFPPKPILSKIFFHFVHSFKNFLDFSFVDYALENKRKLKLK